MPPSRVDGTPYPRDGTPEEKWAWAGADTARRTAEAEAAEATEAVEAEPGEATARWLAEDKWKRKLRTAGTTACGLRLDPGNLVAVIRRPAPARMPRNAATDEDAPASQQRARVVQPPDNHRPIT